MLCKYIVRFGKVVFDKKNGYFANAKMFGNLNKNSKKSFAVYYRFCVIYKSEYTELQCLRSHS